MIDLRKAPYSLSEEDIQWVNDTIASMTIEEKIGQLFCPIGASNEHDYLDSLTAKGIGGIMYRPSHSSDKRPAHQYLQDHSRIPLLLAADLEQGGVGAAADGTLFGRQLMVAATDEPEQAYRLGYVSAIEGAAVGVNWAFSPVIDIDYNWRNPITNIRTYGSDPDRVLAMGSAFIRGVHDAGLAVSIKHFPGDGRDERDQHLHPTVNDMSVDDWYTTYGHIYKTLIDEGADTVMIGHIAQPALVEKINPNATFDEKYTPATLSPELINGVLRGELGFNGMILTDATTMVGFTQNMPRAQAVPYCISIGIDMFLFNREFFEDYDFMMQGYKDGIITDERLNEALTSILGFKAFRGLHKKKAEGTLIPGEEAVKVLACEQHLAWSKEAVDKGITLVKDTRNYLPITPEKYKRIALFVLDDGGVYAGSNNTLEAQVRAEFEARGFEVYEAPNGEFFGRDNPMSVTSFQGRYDLALYILNIATSSSNTVVRIGWKGLLGSGNNPWFSAEIPVVAVSLANPYHLIDLPRIHTYVNTYCIAPDTIHALVDKLTGVSEFKGVSPVDAFCGREDTKI